MIVMSWFMLYSMGRDSGATKARMEAISEGQEYVRSTITLMIENGIIKSSTEVEKPVDDEVE